MSNCFDPKNKTHIKITLICLLLCLCALIPHLSTANIQSTKYPLEKHPANYNAYIQQFDAFMKGQLNIDYMPSEELQNLDNPYDWGQRKSGNIGFYLWDRALYDGQYFSYFGIAPIITVFFPWYVVFKSIPSPAVTCTILAVIGMTSLAFALINLIKHYKIKVPFFLFTLGLFAVEMGSLLPMLMSSADMYYIASCSAVAYFSLFLALFFGGMNSKSQIKKNILFTLCSVAFVLVIMSRPGLSIMGIITVPALCSYFFKNEISTKSKINSLLCFAIPLIIGAIIVCTYNYLRFDSIFEFGAKYQLTVYDVSKYRLSASLIIPCIYHYFVQSPVVIRNFPFIDLQYVDLKMHTTGYLYNTSTIGAFDFLSNFGMFGVGGIFAKSKRHREQKITYILAFLSVLVLAFFNTCMGGINIRYLADFQFVLILFTTLILLEIPSFFEYSKTITKIIVYSVIAILFICSAILGFLLIFENERNFILNALMH